jgi:hypothetical protein
MRRTMRGFLAFGLLCWGFGSAASASALLVETFNFNGTLSPTVSTSSDFYFLFASELPNGDLFTFVQDIGQAPANTSTPYSFDATVPVIGANPLSTVIAAAGSNDPGGVVIGMNPTFAQNAYANPSTNGFSTTFPNSDESSLNQALQSGNVNAIAPQWALPLAPAGYGGQGVIHPYSNVDPMNPMATQFEQLEQPPPPNQPPPPPPPPQSADLSDDSGPSPAGTFSFDVDPPGTPEPATITLLGCGLMAVAVIQFRRSRRGGAR